MTNYSNRMTQTTSVTLYMKMWPVDDLNNATKLAETSAKIYLYLKIQLVHCGDKLFNRCLVDINLKSRKMVNHRLLVINKLLIDFFYVKTWEARRTITACVDSVLNFSGHDDEVHVSLGFLGIFHFTHWFSCL